MEKTVKPVTSCDCVPKMRHMDIYMKIQSRCEVFYPKETDKLAMLIHSRLLSHCKSASRPLVGFLQSMRKLLSNVARFHRIQLLQYIPRNQPAGHVDDH